jgi:hypothetical protein
MAGPDPQDALAVWRINDESVAFPDVAFQMLPQVVDGWKDILGASRIRAGISLSRGRSGE